MSSDEEIVRRLCEILSTADLTTVTVGAIRQQLEHDLRIDLSKRKPFIRQQVDIFLQSHQNEPEPEPEPEEVIEEEEEEDIEVAKEEDEEEEEEEDEIDEIQRITKRFENEPDSKRLKAKINRAIKESLQKDKKKRTGGGGGLNKTCGLSPVLQKLIGEAEMPRTQVVKQLWVYIRSHNLQDPKNKRRIICDDALRDLFGTDSTDMFQMNKLLSKHIWPLEDARDDEDKPKPKKQKVEKSDKKDSGKGRPSGFQTPFVLSEALIDFLGTGERELPLSALVKRIWEYIKNNGLQDCSSGACERNWSSYSLIHTKIRNRLKTSQLEKLVYCRANLRLLRKFKTLAGSMQNPADKRVILCDQKLQDLFGCENFVGFGMTKLLKPHFTKDVDKKG